MLLYIALGDICSVSISSMVLLCEENKKETPKVVVEVSCYGYSFF